MIEISHVNKWYGPSFQVLKDCTVSLITERRVSRPPGLAGGEPGKAGENWLLPGGDESRVERLADKCTIPLKAGEVVRMRLVPSLALLDLFGVWSVVDDLGECAIGESDPVVVAGR
jgi:hypothetical protein